MSTDYRALCAELAGWIERSTRHYIQDPDVLIRARAALAEPVMKEPTDEELRELWLDGNWYNEGATLLEFRSIAHTVLARWGNHSADASKMVSPAPVPADGGVAEAPAVTEVIAWLRTEAEIDDGFELTQSAAYQRRAAELLERQVAPVAAGEVTELVAWLRTISKLFRLDQLGDEADRTDRAADLLEQRHPTPVPVAERLPGPEDCDAEGRCW